MYTKIFSLIEHLNSLSFKVNYELTDVKTSSKVSKLRHSLGLLAYSLSYTTIKVMVRKASNNLVRLMNNTDASNLSEQAMVYFRNRRDARSNLSFGELSTGHLSICRKHVIGSNHCPGIKHCLTSIFNLMAELNITCEYTEEQLLNICEENFEYINDIGMAVTMTQDIYELFKLLVKFRTISVTSGNYFENSSNIIANIKSLKFDHDIDIVEYHMRGTGYGKVCPTDILLLLQPLGFTYGGPGNTILRLKRNVRDMPVDTLYYTQDTVDTKYKEENLAYLATLIGERFSDKWTSHCFISCVSFNDSDSKFNFGRMNGFGGEMEEDFNILWLYVSNCLSCNDFGVQEAIKSFSLSRDMLRIHRG